LAAAGYAPAEVLARAITLVSHADADVREGALARVDAAGEGERGEALRALGLNPAHYPAKVLKCVGELEHTDGKVRKAAVQTLGKLPAEALAAHGAAVVAKLEDAEGYVRMAAVQTLGKLPAEALAAHGAAVVAKLEDAEGYVRMAAVQTLGKLPAEALAAHGAAVVAARLALTRGAACSTISFCTVGLPGALAKHGQIFYEITLKRVGKYPQIGWATPGFAPDGDNGVGDDALSWAADGARRSLWHKGERPWSVSWRDDDVVGCAADIEKGSVWFGLNGVWVAAFEGEGKSWEQGVFPAMSGQHTHFSLNATPRFAGPSPSFVNVAPPDEQPQLLHHEPGLLYLSKDAIIAE